METFCAKPQSSRALMFMLTLPRLMANSFITSSADTGLSLIIRQAWMRAIVLLIPQFEPMSPHDSTNWLLASSNALSMAPLLCEMNLEFVEVAPPELRLVSRQPRREKRRG